MDQFDYATAFPILTATAAVPIIVALMIRETRPVGVSPAPEAVASAPGGG